MRERLSFYIERDSILHKLNPLTKLMVVFTIIFLAFIGLSYWLPAILFIFVIIPLSFLGRVWREFLNATVRLLLPVVGFLFVMQTFFYPGGSVMTVRLMVSGKCFVFQLLRSFKPSTILSCSTG